MANAPTIMDVDVAVVVGPMRTGTTLLARVLDSHPQVAYLGFELAEEWSDWTGVPFGAPGADDVACPPLGAEHATPDRVRGARRGLSELLTTHVSETGHRPDLVVLKNPHFWHRMPFILEVLPHARIVRTRRNPFAVVASLRRLWERALEQHGRVHHLPEAADRCWDFVPRSDADQYDGTRTFPGGRVTVLAEFIRRVESHLDDFESADPDVVVATVTQEDMVCAFDDVMERIQKALGLVPATLHPPEPLDPSRLDEWRQLLDEHEQRAVAEVLA